MGFPNMSPQQQQSHSPQPINLLPQAFPQGLPNHQQMQMFQQQERFAASTSFNASAFASASQATFVQSQAQFMPQTIFVPSPPQAQQAQMQPINNLGQGGGLGGAAPTNIIDLDSQHTYFEDISENLSGQLRMCGININEAGEMASMENMSTDSIYRNLQ
jgi:hypothetical protein